MNEFCYEKIYILLETNPQWRSEKSDCYTYLRGQGAHYDNNEPEKGKVSINEENQRYCWLLPGPDVGYFWRKCEIPIIIQYSCKCANRWAPRLSQAESRHTFLEELKVVMESSEWKSTKDCQCQRWMPRCRGTCICAAVVWWSRGVRVLIVNHSRPWKDRWPKNQTGNALLSLVVDR